MSGLSLLAEAVVGWLSENPDTAMLAVIGGGAYYELHYGRIADMAQNQAILGTAVYALLVESDSHDAEAFRRDLWQGETNGGPYPRDWDQDPAEPPARGDD